MGLMDAKLYVMGGLGVFGIPSYINTSTGDMRGCLLYTSLVYKIILLINILKI